MKQLDKWQWSTLILSAILVMAFSVFIYRYEPFKSGFEITDQLGGNIFPATILSTATTDANLIVPADSDYIGNPKSCIAIPPTASPRLTSWVSSLKGTVWNCAERSCVGFRRRHQSAGPAGQRSPGREPQREDHAGGGLQARCLRAGAGRKGRCGGCCGPPQGLRHQRGL